MHPVTFAYKAPDSNVVALIDRLGGAHAGIVRILRTLHAEQGQLTPHLIAEVARALKMPASRIYGIATFYSLLTTPAPTEKTIRICDGPCCMMRGANKLLSQVQAQMGESWTITRTSCLGLFDWARAALVRESQVGPVQIQNIDRCEIGWCGQVLEYGQPRSGEVRALLPNPETEQDLLEQSFAQGFFPALQMALRKSPESILEELEASQLRGRGGAGFPAGQKWRLVAAQIQKPK